MPHFPKQRAGRVNREKPQGSGRIQ